MRSLRASGLSLTILLMMKMLLDHFNMYESDELLIVFYSSRCVNNF